LEFTSISFIVFIAVVMAVYLIIPHRARAVFLLIASLVFYGFYALWAPVFIILFSLGFFLAARKIHLSTHKRLKFLLTVIGGTVVLYFFLRYSDIWNTFLSALSAPGGINIRIVFPLGFSYYMFKCISYLLDVYHEKMEPEHSFSRFLLYTAYFPEISLGPITRASHFLPQIDKEKHFSPQDIGTGLFMILWGFFKKLIFADQLAILISPYYGSVNTLSSGLGWLAVCFAYFIQLYLDFSAYTDISVGISRVLGFNIKHNFNAPLIAQTMSEYWRRWHISLYTWFSDYVFTPLQFSWRKLNIFASMLAALATLSISGVWHGVTPGFLIWGVLMGICVAFDALVAKKRKKLKKKLPAWLFSGLGITITLLINTLVLSFTRAKSAGDALFILGRIFSFSSWSSSGMDVAFWTALALGVVITTASHLLEWKRPALTSGLYRLPIAVRWGGYIVMLFAIILFSAGGTDIVGGFIYAQF
jgi:alginate O-acetyltransferase complex protein AlgI